MSIYSQHDSLPLPLHNLYYDEGKKLTDPTPRSVSDSNNFLVTHKGSHAVRPGFEKIASSITPTGYTPTKMWLYHGPLSTYIFSSMYNNSNIRGNLYYININAVSPAWTQVSTYRSLDETGFGEHVGVVYKDKFYVRYVPYDTLENYGSVVIYEDATSGLITVVPWGVPKPTVPARIKGVTSKITSGTVLKGHTAFTIADATGMPATPFSLWVGLEEMTVTLKAGTAPSTLTVTRAINGTSAEEYATGTRVYWKDFAASDNTVNVDRGWRYSYGWKSITGHVSSAAPVEFNPDLMPSETGRFKNLKPKVIVQGHADTTNIPKIIIFRSTNGGGNLFICEEITNTGAGNIEYVDDNQASGPTSAVFNDPTLDGKLTVLAPDDTSNDPPPMVNAPGITGTNDPVHSTNMVIYANRIWYAIYNILYYSSNEELNHGVPQEAFDSAVLKGNFIVFEHNIANLQTSQDGLLIKTDRDTHIITGTTKDTFSPSILIPGIGGVGPHNPLTAPNYLYSVSCKIGNGDVWVTQTGTIVIRHNGTRVANIISNPIADMTAIRSLIYLNNSKYEWIVAVIYNPVSTLSDLYIFDLKHYEASGRNTNISSWYPPWKGVDMRSVFYGYVEFTDGVTGMQDYYLVGMGYSTAASRAQLVFMKFGVVYDSILNASVVPTNTNYTAKLKTNYLTPVTGDHFNDLIIGSAYIPFKTLLVEKIYQGYADSEVVKYSSDFSSQVTVANVGSSLVKDQPNTTGLVNLYKYDIDTASRRLQLELSYSADGKLVEIESLTPIWQAGFNVASD